MHIKGEEGNIGRHRKHKSDGDSTADDTHDKCCDRSHLIAADGGFLMLLDIFHSIQTLGEDGHEVGTVFEMWRLCEEEFLKDFIFCHNRSFSFSLSRPRESCFLTASSEVSVMEAISLILYPLR